MADVNGKLAKKSVCLCITLASHGKDVKAAHTQLEDVEDELRKHIESLVQATQLHSFSTRTANKLKQADSRRFWDEHFSEQREVSVETLAEALRFEVKEAEVKGLDSDVILPTCKQCFVGASVTVLGFGEVFATANVMDTMIALSKRVKAQSHMFAVKVFDYEQKKLDQSTEAGFFMCRATDNLKVVRHLVMTHAFTLGDEDDDSDDEFDVEGVESPSKLNNGLVDLDSVPPEFKFMAEGEFSFFLDECAVRVTRKQEKTLEGEDYLNRVVLVRNEDLLDSLKPKKSTKKGNALVFGGKGGPSTNDDTAWETSSAGTSVGEGEDNEAYAEDVAEAIMKRAAEALAVEQCKDIVTALRTPSVLQGLRLAVVRAKLPEEAVTFLVEVDQLRHAAEAISPTGAGALSISRLRMVKASATNICERFLQENASYGLPISAEVRVTATTKEITETAALAEQDDPAPGLDQRMLEALHQPFSETEKALALALGSLQKKQQVQNKVVTVKAVKGTGDGSKTKKHLVVILGGGDTGNTVAFDLCRDSRFHVTLVDPKNYFEDVTAQPMLLCNPGTSTEGRWFSTICPYKTVVDEQSQNSHVAGFGMSISKTHVEVGSSRSVIPYDSLVISTGSRYSSNIKIENPTPEYRLRQLQAEAAVIRHSDTILIIGGGLVGVECSSNIGETYPDKQVILVQSGPVLLPRVDKAHAKIMKNMEKLGVEVHLNERVVEFDDMLREYKTDKGNVFHAGKVYRCTGAVPNTEIFKDSQTDSEISTRVDDKGYVTVDEYCQLNGFDNIYAGGDILEDKMFGSSGKHAVTGEQHPERIAATAFLHGLIIARNLKRKLEGEPEKGPNLCRFDKNNDPFGAALEISLGLECGLGVIHPVLADIYNSMNFTFGIPRAELEADKCGVAPEVARNKENVTALVMGAFQNVDMNAIVVGMFGGDPKMVDPLAPPPGGPPLRDETGGGTEPEAPVVVDTPAAVEEVPAAVSEPTAEAEAQAPVEESVPVAETAPAEEPVTEEPAPAEEAPTEDAAPADEPPTEEAPPAVEPVSEPEAAADEPKAEEAV